MAKYTAMKKYCRFIVASGTLVKWTLFIARIFIYYTYLSRRMKDQKWNVVGGETHI